MKKTDMIEQKYVDIHGRRTVSLTDSVHFIGVVRERAIGIQMSRSSRFTPKQLRDLADYLEAMPKSIFDGPLTRRST